MFKTLKLTNFRKHEALSLDLQPGLVAIRGANEVGKTTIAEAIAYAFFGAKALREPLADVVTYEQPDNTLLVDLTLDTGLNITRGKRGAEIKLSGKVLVTGQMECTRYIETMLGCNADTGAKLMMASQGKLRGALDGGPTEAIELIEGLANFKVIDTIIELINHHLPTGNTIALEEQVRAVDAEIAEVQAMPVIFTGDMQTTVQKLNERLGNAYDTQKARSTELQHLDAAGARRFMVDLAASVRDIDALQPQIDAAAKAAFVEIDEPVGDVAQIEAWRTTMMDLKPAAARRAAYATVQTLIRCEPEVTWDGTKTDFEIELGKAAERVQRWTAELASVTSLADKALAKRINETSCAFCGKDLTDVPEVTRRNAMADAEYQSLVREIPSTKAKLAEYQAEYDELRQVEKEAQEFETVMARYSAFTIWRADRYPARIEWLGEAPPPAPEVTIDYNGAIAAAEARLRAYQQAAARRDAAMAQLGVLQQQRADLQAKVDTATTHSLPAINERVRKAEQLEHEIRGLGEAIEDLKGDLQLAREQLAGAERDNAALAMRALALNDRAKAARAMLAKQQRNNALIKKLRAARPAIADKLWTIVLAAVSHDFSEIRGVNSNITRSDNGFLCDGKSVKGLSGSTLDALGLVIRKALTKTFLPNTSFMLLDEPGAACDDERDTNMLGLIASSGFEQTLLITHKTLADSFANQVVTL